MPIGDMEECAIRLDNKKARYYVLEHPKYRSLKDNIQPLHFYGGNGFAAGVYQPLLQQLSASFKVSSLAMRGYWHDSPNLSEHPVLTRAGDAKALIQFLEKTQDSPVIAVGHSQGATSTAMACVSRPELFQALVLLEPVTFTKSQKLIYDLIPRRCKLSKEPFKSTLTKPTTWRSIDDYYRYLRKHNAYKRVSDEHLEIFAKNSLQKRGDGTYRLIFLPEQELANYYGTPFITDALKRINQLNVPYHIVLGKPSVFVSQKVRNSWQGIVKNQDLTVLPSYGHLLPIEAPEQCADITKRLYA